MIKHGVVLDVPRVFHYERYGVVHVARYLLMAYASRRRFSRYAGVEAWCGAEHQRAPRQREIEETSARPTCILCIMSKSNQLDG